MSERITVRPDVCHGQACIRGTRMPVHQVVRMMANGDTIDGILEDYPTLKHDDVLAALDDAASLAEEEISPIESVSPVI